MTLDDLKARIADQSKAASDAAIEEAFRLGFEAGREDMRADVFKVVEKPSGAEPVIRPTPPFALTPVDQPQKREEADKPKAKRAPKGLTQEVLRRVMIFKPRLSEDEIIRQSIEIDPRLSPKTIYNDLRRHKHLYFRDEEEKWTLRTARREEAVM